MTSLLNLPDRPWREAGSACELPLRDLVPSQVAEAACHMRELSRGQPRLDVAILDLLGPIRHETSMENYNPVVQPARQIARLARHEQGQLELDISTRTPGRTQLSLAEVVEEEDQTPGKFSLHRGDALATYDTWPSPTTIVSDGAYGVGGFHGDPRSPETLVDWYRPHVEAWAKHAKPATTLWFWNTEVGWATVHPLLEANGWSYEFTNIWDKGIAHIAGNVNGKTIRRFPVVTEVCVFYSRKLMLSTVDGELPAQEWMRYEWQRTGLPMYLANEACGVRNAATRKYLTADWLWYFPPADMMARLVAYANERGAPTDRPYYSLDGVRPVTAEEWAAMRYRWNHRHGVTNVWSHPPLHGTERFKGTGLRAAPRVYNPSAASAAHLNQKPLEFMRRIVQACTEPGDVVWEPFGGLCSAAVAAVELGRAAYAAEHVDVFADLAEQRIEDVVSATRR